MCVRMNFIKSIGQVFCYWKETMRYLAKIIHIFLLLISYQSLTWSNDFSGIDEKVVKIIKNKKIYRKAIVETKDNIQSLDYKIYGIHPSSCKESLKKLSRYEKFHEYLDIVKLSGYDDKKELIYLYLDSPIMPFPMVLNFKIERITKPGVYQFSFDKGFLKGLLGHIHVRELDQGCLFFATSTWSGPYTKIPDTIFEIFSETIGELAMENLFRVSKTY